MNWKLTDDRPIWIQLSEQIARGIISGAYPPGSRLPSVRELALQAGVNPNTMQRALAQLEQDGLAKADRTAGRIVTDDAEILEKARLLEAKAKIHEYFNGMEQLGYTKGQAMEMLKGGAE